MQITALLIHHILSIRLANIQKFAEVLCCQGYREARTPTFLLESKVIQPYGREFGKLHMHFPFYTEISFEEIYSKILWQKSKTHIRKYILLQ